MVAKLDAKHKERAQNSNMNLAQSDGNRLAAVSRLLLQLIANANPASPSCLRTRKRVATAASLHDTKTVVAFLHPHVEKLALHHHGLACENSSMLR